MRENFINSFVIQMAYSSLDIADLEECVTLQKLCSWGRKGSFALNTAGGESVLGA